MSSPAISQPVTFNKSLVFNDTQVDEAAYQVLETYDGFILCGLTNYAYHTLVISGLDQSGEILWKKFYGKDQSHHYRPGSYDSMVRAHDSDFVIAVSYADTLLTPYYCLMIIKFNDEGDTIWTKKIYSSETPGRSCYAHGITETNDKGFLVYGEEEYKGVMVKTDSAGNFEWKAFLGNNSYNDSRYIFSACQTSDSGFIIGDYRNNNSNETSGNPVVVRFDKSGNKMWEKGFGGPYHDPMGTFIKPVNDSTFMVITNITTSTSGPPYYEPEESQLELIQIEDDGIVIYDQLAGEADLNLTVDDLEVMSDGTLIAGGTTWQYIPWILNFTAEKKNLLFCLMEFPEKLDYISFFRDITSCSDGGILVCGEFDKLNDRGHYRPWITKTDRFGCLDLGCDSTGIYILKQPQTDTICKNEQTALGIETFSIQGNVSYQWQKCWAGSWVNTVDGPVYQGSNDDTLTIYPASIENNTEYYRCNFYNDYWSFYSESVPVNFLDTLKIISQPQSCFVPVEYTVKFIVSSTGELPVSYQWYHNSLVLDSATEDIYTIPNVAEIDTGSYYCLLTNICGEIKSDLATLQVYHLGVEDEKDPSQIRIHPNPTAGIINIQSPVNAAINEIKLLDLYGRSLKLSGNQIDKSCFQLDLSSFSNGTYFLSIQVDGEKIVEKILKF